jgi:MFS family permease
MTVLGGVIMAIGTVPLFQGLPVWNPVLRNAFGWNASQMSWAFAVTRIEGGVLGPLEGILVERLGSRRMVFIGMMILGAGFILFSQIQELWHLYLTFTIMSLGAALGTWLPMMTVVNHWFVRWKTRAMSVVMEGYALGGIGLPLVMAWAIGGVDPNIAERFGWRVVALGIGITIMALALPLARLVHNRPEEMGLLPDGGSPQRAQAGIQRVISVAELGGYTWQQAIKERSFWLISMGHACSSIVTVAVMVHLGLMLDERGYSLATIGAVVATYTATNATFLLIGGYVGDRIPIKIAAFVFSSIQALAVVILVLAESTLMIFLFALILGAGFGGRSPATTAIRGVYFGRRAFAAIMGVSMVPMNILLFCAPLYVGYVRDLTGNYDISFLTVAIVCFLGSALFLLLEEPKSAPPKPSNSPASVSR